MTPPAAWADLPFFTRDWPVLRDRLGTEPDWQPAPRNVFRALDLTPPEAIRAVILGQDPYPTAGRATGLAFAFPPGERPRDSLRNILSELEADTGLRRPHGDLTAWAEQGVLLLNTVLTVPIGRPNGHTRRGWQALTSQVIARAAQRPAAFLLWGAQAQQAAAPHLDPRRHLVLAAPHPSPLSARRGFFGSRPFSQTNAWLVAQGLSPVDWAA